MRLATLLGLFALLISTSNAGADGFIIVRDPSTTSPTPGHFRFAPLSVTYHHVSVSINDQVATTTVDQEFYNPNSQRLEGTYLFPLPPGAHIDKFSMDVNGKLTDAELLDAAKAKSIYEEIVRKFRDPALLEYTGRDAFKARIFPIEPNSRKQVKITYTELLKSDTGTVEYTYPLNTEKFSARPLENVSVKISLACKDPIKALYSPTHNVEIKRQDGEQGTRATIGYEERNVRPDTDFKLIFSRSKSPVGVDLLTYRNGSDDGYFLLLASPGLDHAAGPVQKRDICFVLDTSGSMAEDGGKKMEQAKRALSFCLQNLNEGDRFEIIRFSTEAETLFSAMTPVSKESVSKAQAFVQSLKPIGGTAIADALQKALSLNRMTTPTNLISCIAPAAPPYTIIFLTDGQPTIGETNEDALVATVKSSNARLFAFGIGTDVNTHLLDRIAAETKAFSQYVLPQEDIEIKLSSFYTKISQPILSNVQLSFTGGDIRTSQIYPGSMPDLFKGEMLVAYGRYSGKGPAAVRISGTINGEMREFVTDVKFSEQDGSRAFIPQLWATRRIGWLLDEIRLRGESTELKDEVTRLAREHGVVTPYTSYLIVEDEMKRNVPLALQTQREFREDAAVSAPAAAKYNSTRDEAQDRTRRAGARAVESAQEVEELKSSSNVAQARRQGQALGKTSPHPSTKPEQIAGAVNYGYKLSQNYAQQARVVNGRAFYQNGPRWTDGTAQTRKDLKQKRVEFNSEEYFTLLASNVHAAQWLALGNEVDVVLGDTLYEIR
jgi:Ca-activated chloride channel family protein